jgi:hypothetical protein
MRNKGTGHKKYLFFSYFLKFCGQCLYFSFQHTNNAYLKIYTFNRDLFFISRFPRATRRPRSRRNVGQSSCCGEMTGANRRRPERKRKVGWVRSQRPPGGKKILFAPPFFLIFQTVFIGPGGHSKPLLQTSPLALGQTQVVKNWPQKPYASTVATRQCKRGAIFCRCKLFSQARKSV